MLKFHEEEEEEEGEGWLASYSDLITDLLAVFVLLFSFALLAQGVQRKATAGVLDGGTSMFDPAYEMIEKVSDSRGEEDDEGGADKIDQLTQELNEQVAAVGLDGQIHIVRQGEHRIMIRMVDTILFDTGKALIKAEVESILTAIANILDGYSDLIKSINVEGHTDNRPISNVRFPSNWELSTGRAGSVVRHLIDQSIIDSSKFSSSGYAEYHPIADNATEEGKALNRRVEIFIELNEEIGVQEIALP